jgi:hypothetical protein
VEMCFTPGEDCTDRIVEILGEAKSSILLQAYSLTSAPIAKRPMVAERSLWEVAVVNLLRP